MKIRKHLTFANVMSSIAVFGVLAGGTAYGLAGTNTVQSDDIGPGQQVKSADVKAGAMGAGKLATDAVGGRALKQTFLSSNGATNITDATHDGNYTTGSDGSGSCPAGSSSTGAWDIRWTGEAANDELFVSEVQGVGGSTIGWLAKGGNDSGATRGLEVRNICITD